VVSVSNRRSNKPMKFVKYMPRLPCRFTQLFEAKPELTTDTERYRGAIEAAVQLEHAGQRILLGCRQDHYLLNVIQNEILRDAALIAFSRAVAVIENLHAVHGQELLRQRQMQLNDIAHIEARVKALRAAYDREVEACHREATRVSRAKNDAYERVKSAAEDEHRAAVIFAAETASPINPAAGDLQQRLQHYHVGYLNKLENLELERQIKVTLLKKACEDQAAPLWQEYLDTYGVVERNFQSLWAEAKKQRDSAIATLQIELEASLISHRAAIDTAYAPFYAAERALELAARALLQQMHEVRKGSSALLADGISELFALAQAKTAKPTTAKPTNTNQDIDTTGGA